MISPALPIPRFLATALFAAICASQPLRAQESPGPRGAGSTAADEGARTETIVFVRHGEKPADDEGQLTCQGLNRALALPDVLIAHYGAAQFVFAPTTTKKPVGSKKSATEGGTAYSYVRPLMTIEPTAIRLGLPVETKFAFDEIGGLQSELTSPAYQHATVFVAWEHHLLVQLVKRLLSAYGSDAAEVPEWSGDDYDSIFVVRIRTEGGKHKVTFAHEQEGLNGMSTDCPQPRKP